jgi:hypothetical protein
VKFDRRDRIRLRKPPRLFIIAWNLKKTQGQIKSSADCEKNDRGKMSISVSARSSLQSSTSYLHPAEMELGLAKEYLLAGKAQHP